MATIFNSVRNFLSPKFAYLAHQDIRWFTFKQVVFSQRLLGLIPERDIEKARRAHFALRRKARKLDGFTTLYASPVGELMIVRSSIGDSSLEFYLGAEKPELMG